MKFSDLESQLVGLKAEGLTDEEAGAKLGYSRRWVEQALAALRLRLNARSTTEVVALWFNRDAPEPPGR